MTGINHVLTGIALAISIRHPLIAPFAAFISHFVIDAIPHFGNFTSIYPPYTKTFKLYLLTEALCITIIIFTVTLLFPALTSLILICALAATAPDIFWLIEKRLHPDNWFRRFSYWFHQGIQWKERPWGWMVELPYAAAAMFGISLLYS